MEATQDYHPQNWWFHITYGSFTSLKPCLNKPPRNPNHDDSASVHVNIHMFLTILYQSPKVCCYFFGIFLVTFFWKNTRYDIAISKSPGSTSSGSSSGGSHQGPSWRAGAQGRLMFDLSLRSWMFFLLRGTCYVCIYIYTLYETCLNIYIYVHWLIDWLIDDYSCTYVHVPIISKLHCQLCSLRPYQYLSVPEWLCLIIHHHLHHSMFGYDVISLG